MRIGKNFIRNCITEQFRAYSNYYAVDRVDVILRGKQLGYACKDLDGSCYWLWKDGGEIAKSLREARKTLRANIRSFVREVTDKIYERGLKHSTDWRVPSERIIDEALDAELADFYPVDEHLPGGTYEVYYWNLTDEI